MRIGYSSQYINLSRYQQNHQSKLTGYLTQISSGQKIQFGYQGSSVFNQALRLDYEETTLNQSKTLNANAKNFSDNTDAALSELSKAMMNFNTKLVQASNQIHSSTSLNAIANDLQAIKEHMLSIANTSVGGEYLFGGTAITTKPFDSQGRYNGNSGYLKALVGSNNLLGYNITGSELFFGSDSDKNRIITTNVKNFNQSKLNPGIMDSSNKNTNPEEVYLKSSDTLRDLIGDNNDDTTDTPDEWFYIQGVKPDGSSFKEKFSLSTAYANSSSATTVQDLLDRIGRAFGNTTTNKVVDVSLNEYGSIQIKDLTKGRSNIDFYMVSSDQNVNNLDDLLSNGARVQKYVQSPFSGEKTLSQVSSNNDYYDHRVHTIGTTFRTSSNVIAKPGALLSSLLGPNTTNISLGGNAANNPDGSAGAAVPAYNFPITATTTVQDLLDSIKTNFAGGGDIDVEFTNGQIKIVDKNVSNISNGSGQTIYNGSSSFSITMQAQDALGASTNAFANDYTVEYDRVAFSKQGSKLTSNISQIINANGKYATSSTKLSEAAGASLDGSAYKMQLKDVNGLDVEVEVNFSNTTPPGSTFTINGADTFTIFNPHDAPPAVTAVKADEMSYQQLMDVMTVALNHSNIRTTPEYTNALSTTGTADTQKTAFESLLKTSQGNAEVSLNTAGQLEIRDLIRSETRMSFMMYDANTSDFSATMNKAGSAMTFQANNALTVDDPQIDFFAQIDKVIEAVRKGIYRAGDTPNGAYSDDLRSTGIQGALQLIEHLSDRVNKVQAKNGAQGNALEYMLERTELLIVQNKTLRSEVADVDIADVYNKFSQLTLNYQATLTTIGKINQLSLVNYI